MVVLEKEEIIKSEILMQAQKLFQQYGLKKTTMDEIAAACGKAKSTLYHYFRSKEDVFDEVIFLEMMNLRKQVKAKVEKQETMLGKIKTYVYEFHREIIHKVNLYRIIRQDHIDPSAEITAKKRFLKMMEFERSYITRIMEDGYDSGEYTEVAREDIPWLAEMFLAAFLGTMQYIVEKEGIFEDKKLRKLTNIFVPKLFG